MVHFYLLGDFMNTFKKNLFGCTDMEYFYLRMFKSIPDHFKRENLYVNFTLIEFFTVSGM